MKRTKRGYCCCFGAAARKTLAPRPQNNCSIRSVSAASALIRVPVALRSSVRFRGWALSAGTSAAAALIGSRADKRAVGVSDDLHGAAHDVAGQRAAEVGLFGRAAER